MEGTVLYGYYTDALAVLADTTTSGSIRTPNLREKPVCYCPFGFDAFCVLGRTNLAVETDSLSKDQQTRIHVEAPLWMNRFAAWQVHSSDGASASLLPAPSNRRFRFLQLVAKHSKIVCLYDVFMTAGWPSSDDFIQRVLLDFATAGEPLPRRQSVLHLNVQLSAIKDRAPASTSPARTEPSTVPWPWILRTPKSYKRFPALPSKPLPHPLLRHNILGADQLVSGIRHSSKLRRYLSPVYYDVRFRVWWYLLPVADKYGSATYRSDRYCQHGCRHVENYRHVFFDCRIARPLWRVHFDAWKPILLGIPGWKDTLFGMDITLRRPFRSSARGALLLWNMICSIVFHTLWSLRNDKKHRSIDVPLISVLVDRNVGTLKAHSKEIHRAAAESTNETGDLTQEIDIIASTLKLTSQ